MSNADELAGIIQREYIRAINRNRPGDAFMAPADAILAAGYRKSRTITTAEELDTLAAGSVIIDRDGDAWQRARAGWTCTYRAANTQNQPSSSLAYVLAPATVLYTPEES